LEAGFDPLLHMSCRDRNRVALHGELLGAANLGISSLLITRGSRLRSGRRSRGVAVFDIGATDLIATARILRETESPSQYGLTRASDFFIGDAATVFNAVANWQPRALTTKLDAGAQFLQSQLCFDLPVLRRYMQHLVGSRLTHRAYVVISLAPLQSAEMARQLRETLRGTLIPDDVIRRLQQARDAERTGVDICAELLQEMAEIPGVSGAHLVSTGEPEAIRAAIAASGLRRQPPAAIRAPPA
jgi:5,10-methylenetetrahydrofolate reductase